MTQACAHCGELFDGDRLACPHCGADADLTWSGEEAPSISDGDEDYDAFVAREFGETESNTRWVPIVIGLVVLALLVWLVAG